MDPKQREKNKNFLEGFDALVFSLVLVLVLLTFVARTASVGGRSMMPTLRDGDQVLVYSFFYTPQRGDVVLVDSYIGYGKPLVKRVIAIGGDEVDINPVSGEVLVNGEVLDESAYVSSETVADDVVFPITVPEGHVFVMGDNRADSKDSRSSEVGFIDNKEILGKVILRIFPTNKFGWLE